MKKLRLSATGSNEVALSKLFHDFFHSEKAGGLILICCTLLSLGLANSPFQNEYLSFWKMEFDGHSINHWINDGLMAIFFLLIGLELEREIYTGELSNIRSASLPMFAAVGGMVVPAGMFFLLNKGTLTQPGTGIPMATDIAFAIGILSLVGKGIPNTIKIFLTALAVMDDLGAILVIAVFYTKTLLFSNLFFSLAIFAALVVMNRLKVRNLLPYLIGGAGMWYFMLHSGIHATITGVLLAFAVPFGDGGEKSPSYILQHLLHKPVAFAILPLFALANTGLILSYDWYNGLTQPLGLGIILGLFLGKPIGIVLFSLVGVGLGLCALPAGSTWKHLVGVGFLGGIGFTMSIFITLLAFDCPEHIDISKIAVLVASVLSGLAGYFWLKRTSIHSIKTIPKETLQV